MGTHSAIFLEILVHMRDHRVCRGRGNIVWDLWRHGPAYARVGLSGAYTGVGGCTEFASYGDGCERVRCGVGIVKSLVYVGWTGAQRVAVGKLLRSEHIQEMKAMIFKLYRMAAKSRLELGLEMVRRTARRRRSFVSSEVGKHRHVSQQSGICCDVTYA